MKINTKLISLSNKLAEAQLILNNTLIVGNDVQMQHLERKLSEVLAAIVVLDNVKEISLKNIHSHTEAVMPSIYDTIVGTQGIFLKLPEEIRREFKVVK